VTTVVVAAGIGLSRQVGGLLDLDRPAPAASTSPVPTAASVREWLTGLPVVSGIPDVPWWDEQTHRLFWGSDAIALPEIDKDPAQLVVPFFVTERGLMLAETGRRSSRLLWVTRVGATQQFTQLFDGNFSRPVLSPDGSRYAIVEGPAGAPLPLPRGELVVRRMTDDREVSRQPIPGEVLGVTWTPAGILVDRATVTSNGAQENVQISGDRSVVRYAPEGHIPVKTVTNQAGLSDSWESYGPRHLTDRLLWEGSGPGCVYVATAEQPSTKLREVCAEGQAVTLSPDGRKLLVGLEVVDVETGRSTPLDARTPDAQHVPSIGGRWLDEDTVLIFVPVNGSSSDVGYVPVRCQLGLPSCQRSIDVVTTRV
jgi:hypothetical protein